MNPEDKEALIAKCQTHVGAGWGDILSRLIHDLFELGWDGQVVQVKEKFGGLRFYVGRATEAMYNRICAAENEALQTCEECGAPGVLRDDGWLKTLCDEHAKGRAAHPHLNARFKRGA